MPYGGISVMTFNRHLRMPGPPEPSHLVLRPMLFLQPVCKYSIDAAATAALLGPSSRFYDDVHFLQRDCEYSIIAAASAAHRAFCPNWDTVPPWSGTTSPQVYASLGF